MVKRKESGDRREKQTKKVKLRCESKRKKRMAKERRCRCRKETKETNRLLRGITEMMEEMVRWMRGEGMEKKGEG